MRILMFCDDTIFSDTMRKAVLFTLMFCLLAGVASAQKVGLVLSGGGAKGLYHIGVIRALEENGIPVDCVSGTSMGAIIGGLYAIGMTPAQMERELTPARINDWITGKIESRYNYFFKQMNPDAAMLTLRFDNDDRRIAPVLPTNLASSTQLDMAFIESFAGATVACRGNFDSLVVPFRCISTDAVKRREVVFRNGDLGKAIRTSMTIPLVFRPIVCDSMVLYDGGLYNNFPWQVLEEDFRPDILIGSKCVEGNVSPETSSNLMDQVFVITMLHTDYSLPDSTDIMIDRVFPDVTTLDFSKAAQIIQAGYDDAIAKMPLIKERITRRTDPQELSARRMRFKAARPPIVFGDCRIEGLNSKQIDYVERVLCLDRDHGQKHYTFNEFKSEYFKILAEGEIEPDYPEVVYNPATGMFDLTLRMHTKPSFKVKVGGNISSTSLNQAYIGLEYRNIARSTHIYNLDGYFSPFYVSTSLSARTDFFIRSPFYYQAGISYNYYNYYRSDYGGLSRENDLTYAKYGDSYAWLEVGLPLGRHSVLNLQANAATDNYQYSESSKAYRRGDTLDRTRFDFLGLKLEAERNNVNYYLYPTRGIKQSVSGIFVTGRERFTPGSAGDSGGLQPDRTNRTWLGAQFVRERYFGLDAVKWFSAGYLVNLTYTNHPDFDNPNATNLTSPAFTPTPHSKLVYMSEFRAPSFAGIGVIPIFEFTPSFYLRMSAYAFLPESFNGNQLAVKKRLRYMFDSSLVYQTLVGPVSLSLSKYDTNRNNWFITFNFGLAIFNKKGLFY